MHFSAVHSCRSCFWPSLCDWSDDAAKLHEKYIIANKAVGVYTPVFQKKGSFPAIKVEFKYSGDYNITTNYSEYFTEYYDFVYNLKNMKRCTDLGYPEKVIQQAYLEDYFSLGLYIVKFCPPDLYPDIRGAENTIMAVSKKAFKEDDGPDIIYYDVKYVSENFDVRNVVNQSANEPPYSFQM